MVAALLHDVLDDTDVEYAEVEEQFGSEVGCSQLLYQVLRYGAHVAAHRMRDERRWVPSGIICGFVLACQWAMQRYC